MKIPLFDKCLMTALILCALNCAIGALSTMLDWEMVGVVATYVIFYQMTVYLIVFPIWGLVKLWR